jgi:hypothetical protein
MPQKTAMTKLLLLCGLFIPAVLQAQTYAVNWYKVAGGGGTSSGTNGPIVYTLKSTIGQQDASTALSGGGYTLTGGFWSYIAVVQIPGGPLLTITETNGTIVVSWPSPSTGYYLQTTRNLTLGAAGWNYLGLPIVTNGGVNSVTVASSGQRFFRLSP